MLHGSKLLLHLLKLWYNTNQLVNTDSYFAFIFSEEPIIRNSIKFVGVIKTDRRKLPMYHISRIEIGNRGDTSDLARRNTPDSYECDLMDNI